MKEGGERGDHADRRRDGRRLGDPQRRGRVLVAADRRPEAGAGSDTRAATGSSSRRGPSSSCGPARARSPSASPSARPGSCAHQNRPTERIRGSTMRGPHPIEIWVDRSGSPYAGLVGKPVLRTAGRARRGGRARVADRSNLSRSRPPLPVSLLRAVQAPGRDRARERPARPQRRGPPGSRRLRGGPPGGDLPALDARRRRREQGASTRAGWSRTRTSAITWRPARTRSSGGEPPPGARAWPEERRQRELAELEHDAMYAISRYLQTQAYRATERRREGARRARAERRLQRQVRDLRRRAERQRAAPAEDRIEPLVAPSSPAAERPRQITRGEERAAVH